MGPDSSFSLQQTLAAIQEALYGVTCHILYDAALHGLVVGCVVALIGLCLKPKKTKASKPMVLAGFKIMALCTVLAIPGAATLYLVGGLPETGYYESNTLGYLCFWSYVAVWFTGEHINHQWFDVNIPKRVNVENEEETETSEETQASRTA